MQAFASIFCFRTVLPLLLIRKLNLLIRHWPLRRRAFFEIFGILGENNNTTIAAELRQTTPTNVRITSFKDNDYI